MWQLEMEARNSSSGLYFEGLPKKEGSEEQASVALLFILNS